MFQNHVEWTFPDFFNWIHLYDNWWFSWHMFSEMNSLLANLIKVFRKFTKIVFVNKNFSLPFPEFEFHNCSLFFRWWHDLEWSGIISWAASKRALQLLSSSSSLLIDAGTGLTLLTVFLSNWIIRSLRRWFQFIETASAEDRI